jgi:hypothetical protein
LSRRRLARPTSLKRNSTRCWAMNARAAVTGSDDSPVCRYPPYLMSEWTVPYLFHST